MLSDSSAILHRRAVDGDAAARDALLGRLRGRLLLWASARMSAELRASCDPEDVAQEALLAVHRDFERAPRTEPEFKSWFFTVAENRVRDLVDRVRAAKRNGEPPRVGRQPTPSSIVGHRETADGVRRALATLPDDHRRVIMLRRIEERDTPEVARLMERSEGAVRVLYSRALHELRTALERMDSATGARNTGARNPLSPP